MLRHRLMPDGGFAVLDTATGNGAYAYPSSPYATRARRAPGVVASEMASDANHVAGIVPADIMAEFSDRVRAMLG